MTLSPKSRQRTRAVFFPRSREPIEVDSVLKATILGCGSSGGVPRIGGVWGACDPSDSRNRRRRCSLLLEKITRGGATNVLVDSAPDMREQLLEAGIGSLDGVLYTHSHADQTHGINDLRMVAINMRRRVPVYMDEACADVLTRRFDYCFQDLGQGYPPTLSLTLIAPGEIVEIAGEGGVMRADVFSQDHGSVQSLGFRFGDLAYSSDVVDLDDDAFAALKGVRTWIVDALRWLPHPTHAHLDKTLTWIERVRPERAILTNLDIDLDYAALKAVLPDGVEPAHDGMVLETRM